MRRPSAQFPQSIPHIPLRSLITLSVGLAGAMSLILSICFFVLGYEVERADTLTIDDHILRSVVTQTLSWPLAIPTDVTLLGSSLVVANVTALLMIWLLWRRRWFDALFIPVVVAGSAGMAFVIKHLIARPRPAAFSRVAESGYSFPSGHTTNITALVLASAFLLWRSSLHIAIKLVGSLLFAVSIVAVGASRLALGVHYPTDILGSIVLDSAWFSALIALRWGIERASRIALPPGRSRTGEVG